MIWVGIDANYASHLAANARLFQNLAFAGMDDRLAEIHRSTRKSPVPIVSPLDEEDPPGVIRDDNIHRGHQAVGRRRVRVIEVVDTSHLVRVSRRPRFIRLCLCPYALEAVEVVIKEAATWHPAQMHHGVLRCWRPIHMHVDQEVIVEAIERVVEDRRVEAHLDAWNGRGRTQVTQACSDPS